MGLRAMGSPHPKNKRKENASEGSSVLISVRKPAVFTEVFVVVLSLQQLPA
jgi:hypothetical protein